MDETRHYFYNQQWQVIEERVGADPVTARVDAQYVWHPEYVDSLALRYWDSNASGGPDLLHYYLQDANYNVTALVNGSGDVVERYAYTPYGEVTILNGASDADGAVADFSADANGLSDVKNVYLYTGRERDLETGLQINRHRYYASHLGRWPTRDPIGYDGSEGNLYQYVGNSPLAHLDPLGEAIDSLTGSIERCLKLPYPANLKCIDDLIWVWGKRKRFDIVKCEMVYAAYDKLRCSGCSGCITQAEVLDKIKCLTTEIAIRSTYLRMRCDYILPGSIGRPGGSKAAESGHQQQLNQKSIMLAKCTALLARLPK